MANDLFDEDEEQTESNPVADQRNHIKELEKAARAAEKRAAEAETRISEMEATRRNGQAANYFKAAGLSERFAGLYLSANPDAEVTEEGVQAFAADYGLAPTSEGAPAPEPVEQAPPFVPVPGAPPNQMLSYDKFKELLTTAPTQAWALMQQGMVDMPGIEITQTMDGGNVVEGSWVK